MKNKIIISLIAIIFSLQGGFVFAEKVYFSQDNPVNTANDDGLVLNSFHYSSGTLKLSLTFGTGTTHQDINTIYIPSGQVGYQSNGYFALRLSCSNLSYPHDEYYLASVACDTPEQISGNWFCPLDRGQTIDFSISNFSGPYYYEGGLQYPYVAYSSVSKTLLDSYFGTDFLEDNNCYLSDLNAYSPSPYTGAYYYRGELWTSAHTNNPIFPYSSAPPVINGTCGSNDNGSFYTLEDDDPDLCSTGTLACPYALCYGSDLIDNGTTYSWKCEGSGGGTYEMCSATHLATTAQCGYASGTYSTSEPTGSNACLEGVISDMTQQGDNSWTWDCVASGSDYVSCETFATAPIIPDTLPSDDSIDCDISPTDLSTIGDCLGSVGRWLFLPHQDTLNEFYQIPQSLKTKIPFGYFYAITDLFKTFTVSEPGNLVFTGKNIDGSDMTLLDVNAFKTWFGEDIVNFYFNALRALLWIAFTMWVYAKGRAIFNDNDNDK